MQSSIFVNNFVFFEIICNYFLLYVVKSCKEERFYFDWLKRSIFDWIVGWASSNYLMFASEYPLRKCFYFNSLILRLISNSLTKSYPLIFAIFIEKPLFPPNFFTYFILLFPCDWDFRLYFLFWSNKLFYYFEVLLFLYLWSWIHYEGDPGFNLKNLRRSESYLC